MKIAIGGDHAGFPLKGPVIELLQAKGHEITDYGTYSLDPVDFPDIAAKAVGGRFESCRGCLWEMLM